MSGRIFGELICFGAKNLNAGVPYGAVNIRNANLSNGNINRSICLYGVAICITNKQGGGWSPPPERRKNDIQK